MSRHSKSPKLAIEVRGGNIDQALRVLKKKLQQEGVFREMKLKQHFEKPSEKKARENGEALRRLRRAELKKIQKEYGVDRAAAKAIMNGLKLR